MVFVDSKPWYLSTYNATCQLYQLNPGLLSAVTGANSSNTTSIQLTRAAIYLTNCTAALGEIEQFYVQHYAELQHEVLGSLTDPFSKSVIMANYATCAVTVSAWMLFLVQLLSITYKPALLRLSTLLLACVHTYFLTRYSRLMRAQFDGCYQDNYELVRLTSDSIVMCAMLLVLQVLSWAACAVGITTLVGKLRQPVMLGKRRDQKSSGSGLDWVVCSVWVFEIVVVLTLVFAGLLHFYAVPAETHRASHWVNVLEMCLTCYAYVYMFVVLTLFVMTRISFSFRFQSLVLLALIVLFFVLAAVLNMIWLADPGNNMKWLVGVYLLMQHLSLNLMYEFVANWKLYDRKEEHRGIVGRAL